jgi:hypothetical protein
MLSPSSRAQRDSGRRIHILKWNLLNVFNSAQRGAVSDRGLAYTTHAGQPSISS